MVNAANLDQVAEAGLTQVCYFACLYAIFFVLELFVSCTPCCQVFRFIQSVIFCQTPVTESEPAFSLSETLLGDMTFFFFNF